MAADQGWHIIMITWPLAATMRLQCYFLFFAQGKEPSELLQFRREKINCIKLIILFHSGNSILLQIFLFHTMNLNFKHLPAPLHVASVISPLWKNCLHMFNTSCKEGAEENCQDVWKWGWQFTDHINIELDKASAAPFTIPRFVKMSPAHWALSPFLFLHLLFSNNSL